MPNFQHRGGAPARTRLHDHTRWENQAPDMPWWVWALIPFLIVGFWVVAS